MSSYLTIKARQKETNNIIILESFSTTPAREYNNYLGFKFDKNTKIDAALISYWREEMRDCIRETEKGLEDAKNFFENSSKITGASDVFYREVVEDFLSAQNYAREQKDFFNRFLQMIDNITNFIDYNDSWELEYHYA